MNDIGDALSFSTTLPFCYFSQTSTHKLEEKFLAVFTTKDFLMKQDILLDCVYYSPDY